MLRADSDPNLLLTSGLGLELVVTGLEAELILGGSWSFLNSGFFSWTGPESFQPTGKSGGLVGTHSAAMYFFFSYFCLMNASMAWSF